MARQAHNSQRKQEVVRACFKRMDTAPKVCTKRRQDLGWRHPRRLGGLDFEEHVAWTAVMAEHSRRKGQSGCVCVSIRTRLMGASVVQRIKNNGRRTGSVLWIRGAPRSWDDNR